MRLTKSLLCGVAALGFAVGTAFAGLDSTMESSSIEDGDRQYFVSPESDVMYLYPIEVTEYYLIIPQSSELG